MKINRRIQSYNKLFYSSGPITVDEYLRDDLNIIHDKLYQNALSRFLHDADYPERLEYIDNQNIRIIEIKNSEYWRPSEICIIDYSQYPRTIKKHSLEDYWENEFVSRSNSRIDNIQAGPYQEVDYLDYIHGKAVILDRLENERYRVDFKDLSPNLPLSEDFDAYKNTFESKRYTNG